jgi:hypothetical protein
MSEFLSAVTAHDADPWCIRDTIDLLSAARDGLTLEQAAVLLGRVGTLDRIKRKADQLGIAFQA